MQERKTEMTINREDIKNNRIIRHVWYFTKGLLRRSQLRKKAEETAERFQIPFSSEEEKQRCLADMLRMNRLYGYDFDEYFLFRFAEKPLRERRTFVADWEHLGYTCAMNNPANAQIYDNKWKTYQTFRDFFHRELLYCDAGLPEADFRLFEERHPSYIVKPLDATCGRGVRVAHSGEDLQALLRENGGRFLAEELIVQAPELAKLHPASVNTVRVPTISYGDSVEIVHPFLRVGQHGSLVDNAGFGGIICTLDVDTGRVIAAADEHGNHYENHPDTKERILGFVVPRWDEAKKVAAALARVVPDNHYTGWDLACTKDGAWVLVEANRRGQFLWQISDLVGFRKEIKDDLARMGKKY